jgi:hypothetical protein
MCGNYVHNDFDVTGRHLVSKERTWGSGEATHIKNLLILTDLNEKEITGKRSPGKRRNV